MSKKLLAAMAAAGLCTALTSPALAQNVAATTAGGDVTADEATPLPPIVVQSPSEPIRRKARRSTASTPSAAPGVVFDDGEGFESDGVGSTGTVGAFTLGQIDMVGGSTITNEAMWTYNKQSLDEAVSIAPGVSAHTTGGRRNERDIYVRGFDRIRVPLSIDGVRVYLPADNRLDMNRFLTPDLAEIQIQKGYVSVLNGPGGMGGAINMVSRKPTKAFEAEGRAGIVTTGDINDLNQWSSYAYAGTRQKGYYAQISGTIVDQDHFNLSDDFRPRQSTPFDLTFPYENGGIRENSDFRDWRINAKIGITPNATDEYSINYTTQSGRKNAALHVAKEQLQTQRYWQWPWWDIQSLSWLSKTQLGSASYVKTNVYYNTFENRLSSFDDATYSSMRAINPTFHSDYDDFAYGGFVEMGTELIPMNTLKGAIHYRRDDHSERNIQAPDNPGTFTEPWHGNVEDTWSFAIENTFHAARNLDIIAGLSYDYLDVKEANDFRNGAFVNRQTTTADAWSYQGGAIYRFSDTGSAHATISSRTRFATVFERYSERFGFAVPNPDLAPERSTNYEIGATETFFNQARVSGAVFYSDLQDSIQSAYIIRPSDGAILSQNQNVTGEHYGFEVSVDWDLAPGLRVGGNYTYLHRSYDYITPGTRPEGTPDHEAFLYLAWDVLPNLTITPSLALASDRNSIVASGRTRTFIETGSYALANVQAEYRFNDNASAAIGVTNLFDDNYELVEGFPEAGRQFFANARVKF
ncbi:MAG TPA: TonB-dependent receptor [Hyphomicrobium sp.]|nr:TonB-dependent receptor [Hyphomicrobium sp.]HRO49817.1 TonB-dependent receptor [Hyphomicrobium sp.]